MSFATQCQAWAERAGDNLDRIIAGAVEDLGDRLIVVSAEDTGRFKSNWNYGFGAPDYATTEKTAVRTLNGLSAMPAEAAGGMHYVSNSLPYALRLEYGFSGPDSLGRVYNQPPRPMLGLVKLEWPQILEHAAKRVAA